jgi:hypothetical protein
MTLLEARERLRRAASMPSAWLILSGVFALAAGLLFLYNGVRYANETESELRLIPYLRYDHRVDFGYFYAGAALAWHGDASELYPEPGEWTFYPDDAPFFESVDDYAYARLLARGNYYNPPALAYIESPLTPLGFRNAFWLFSGLSLSALAGFLLLGWRAGAGIPELPFLAAGIVASRPVHEAVIMGHMPLFFVFFLTAGFLLLRAERQVLAGLCLSLLALKPQWAVLPGLFLLVRGEWRSLGTMAASAAAIFLIPFAITGWHTLDNYVNFLRFSATVDLKDAPHMFSWNGFLSKLDGSEVQNGQVILYLDAPSKALVYGLIALTAVPLVVVWWSRDFMLGAAATVVAMLLVSTHSVWYDWALLVVAALFLVLRLRGAGRVMRVETWVVLLALTLACSQSTAELLTPDRHLVNWHRAAFYSATPVAFLSLIWMASLTLREGLLKMPAKLSFARQPAAG